MLSSEKSLRRRLEWKPIGIFRWFLVNQAGHSVTHVIYAKKIACKTCQTLRPAWFIAHLIFFNPLSFLTGKESEINRKLRVATEIGSTFFRFLTSYRAAEIVQNDYLSSA
jgi:hypothetical protein